MNGPVATLYILEAALVALGIALGLAIGYFAFPKMRQAKQLRDELDRLRSEHETYKSGVSEHFEKTADLVGEMTKSYAAVYDHLAGGARRFCGDALADKALAFGPQLATLGKPDGGASTEDDGVVIETPTSADEAPLPAASDSAQAVFPDTQGATETTTAGAAPHAST